MSHIFAVRQAISSTGYLATIYGEEMVTSA
jgi:hypothetical protein